jgi:DNA-binding transcriptional regulator YiaG
MAAYHYRECGLDNVTIDGVVPCQDDDGDEVITIPNITGLHREIASAIVQHKAGISGKELRFLRTEMGMTQAELANVVHHDTQSIGRWERGEVPIDPSAEVLIRLLAVERLDLKATADSLEELSRWCVSKAAPQPIKIDGNDPANYRLLEAA